MNRLLWASRHCIKSASPGKCDQQIEHDELVRGLHDDHFLERLLVSSIALGGPAYFKSKKTGLIMLKPVFNFWTTTLENISISIY